MTGNILVKKEWLNVPHAGYRLYNFILNVEKFKYKTTFSKYLPLFKKYQTNTMHVCTHLNAYFMLNSNTTLKILGGSAPHTEIEHVLCSQNYQNFLEKSYKHREANCLKNS